VEDLTILLMLQILVQSDLIVREVGFTVNLLGQVIILADFVAGASGVVPQVGRSIWVLVDPGLLIDRSHG
jgi:hypothetical protein